MYKCKDDVCDPVCDFCWYCEHDKNGAPIYCKNQYEKYFADGVGYCDDFVCRLHEPNPMEDLSAWRKGTFYYHIIDLDLIGKEEGYVPYIYKNGQWVVDKDNVLMDRIMGYDGDDIGCTDMLNRVENIPKSEADKYIQTHR